MSTRSKGHGDARRADESGYASRHDSAACQVGQSHCVGVTGQGLRGPRRPANNQHAEHCPSENFALVVGATTQASDRSPTGWFALSRRHGYVASDRSDRVLLKQRRQCARSMLSHSYCTSPWLVYAAERGRIHWETRAGYVVSASNGLTGCYVTYISKPQREGSYLCCSRAVTRATVSCRCRGNTTSSHWTCMLSFYLML